MILQYLENGKQYLHIACLAHAIHISVSDVQHKEKSLDEEPIGEDNVTEENGEEEESNEAEDDFEEDFNVFLAPEINTIVAKVRRVVKLCRKSPVRNDDNLQPQIIVSCGKEKALFLDCKTRWNSLLKMLQRLYELRKKIKVAMVQLDGEFDFSYIELDKIKELCDALAPIELAVGYLCKNNADLFLAEKVIEFTLKLRDQGTKLSKALKKNFEAHVEQRRHTDLIHLLNYLKFPDFLNEYEDQFGNKIRRCKIVDLATSLLKRLYPSPSCIPCYKEVDTEVQVVEVAHFAAANHDKEVPKQMRLFPRRLPHFLQVNNTRTRLLQVPHHMNTLKRSS